MAGGIFNSNSRTSSLPSISAVYRHQARRPETAAAIAITIKMDSPCVLMKPRTPDQRVRSAAIIPMTKQTINPRGAKRKMTAAALSFHVRNMIESGEVIGGENRQEHSDDGGDYADCESAEKAHLESDFLLRIKATIRC